MQFSATLISAMPRLRHICFVCLEVVAGLLLVVLVAAGLLLWRLSSGDLSVSFLNTPIERAVNAQIKGYKVDIGDTVIERAGSAVSLRLKNIVLHNDLGQVVAQAPKAAIGIDAVALLSGTIRASRFDLIGARLAVIYGADGKLRVSMVGGDGRAGSQGTRRQDAVPDQAATHAPTGGTAGSGGAGDSPDDKSATAFQGIRELLSAKGDGTPLGALQSIGISDTDAVFVHEPLGIEWRIRHGDMNVSRSNGGLLVDISASMGAADMRWPLSMQVKIADKDGITEITGQIADLVPRVLAGNSEQLSVFAMADMPVSGRYSLTLEQDGNVRSLSFAAELKAGYLRMPGSANEGLLVDEATLRVRYDPGANVIWLDPSQVFIGRSQGIVSGVISPSSDAGPDAGSWRYALEAKDVVLAANGQNEQPMAIGAVVLEGRVAPDGSSLWLDRGELVAGDAGIAISAAVRPGARSPAVDLTASFSPMPIKTLIGMWPKTLAGGARSWVAANIKDGRLSDGTLNVRLPEGAIADLEAGGKIAPGAISADFGVSNIISSYLDPLPLLWDGMGRGRLDGERFELDVHSAHVLLPSGEKLNIPAGRISVASVSEKIPRGVIEMRIEGKVPAILEMLDHEPLGYMSDIGMTAGDFSGDGQVDLSLELPFLSKVRFDQVKIAAEAEMRQLSARKVFGGHDATSGVLLMKVDNDGLQTAGEVLISDQRAQVVWSLPFAKADSGKLTVRMTLDDAGRKKLGIDLPFLQGPIDVAFSPRRATGGKGASDTEVSADIKMARLSFPDIAWIKERSQAGQVSFVLHEAPNGILTLKDFLLTTDDAHINGQMTLEKNGTVRSANFDQFRLSSLDRLSLRASRKGDKQLEVEVNGDQLDGRAMLKGLFGSLGDSEQEPSVAGRDDISVKARIAKIIGNEATDIHDVSLDIQIKDARTQTLELAGRFEGDAQLSARIAPGGSAGRTMVLSSGDAGAVLRLVGLYSKAVGGKMEVLANLPAKPSGNTRGRLKITKFQIRNEPILGQIAAAGPAPQAFDSEGVSIQRGVNFDLLSVPFTRSPGVLRLDESVMRGASLGATLKGEVDFTNDQVNLSGTYLPLYALNNLLSHVPIVGLFMGGKNEGLIGITFAIRGTPDRPSVSINPVSAVTPGIFRKIFDFGATGTISSGKPGRRGVEVGRPEQPIPEAR